MKSAFTLVEMLIVVSLMVVVSAATIPSFVGYLSNQDVSQAKSQLKSDLRTFEMNSLNRVYGDKLINSGPNGTGALVAKPAYWGIKFFKGTYCTFLSDSFNYPSNYKGSSSNTDCRTNIVSNNFVRMYSLPNGYVLHSPSCAFLMSRMKDGVLKMINCSDSANITSTSSGGGIEFEKSSDTSVTIKVNWNTYGRFSN